MATDQSVPPPGRLVGLSVVAAIVLLTLGGVGAWLWFGSRAHTGPAHVEGDQLPPPPPDPRLTFETPFRNVRPEVKYVGDAACAPCHKEIDHTYHQHPMGRSMAAAATVPVVERFTTAAHDPFQAFGLTYRVERKDGRLIDHEIVPGDDGKELLHYQEETPWVLGSGERGRSYLCVRGDTLWQSPISWFSEKAVWDIAPGFTEHRHFLRPILPTCLYCHASAATPVPNSLNRYAALFPHQPSIGCERCHGPGELHVRERQASAPPSGIDTSIVNPNHLDQGPRDAICEQCHLQGEKRVERLGRSVFDYRPGLPQQLFWTAFVRRADLTEGQKAVGQVEQMTSSRCYLTSNGRLGCTSCHDPHATRPRAERPAYYRSRCLECHAQHGCSAPRPERLARKDDCVACHMPRRASADIAHTAVTDHRILRRPGAVPKPMPHISGLGALPLVPFHKDRAGVSESALERDTAIALASVAVDHPSALGPLGREAGPRLEGAVQRRTDDVAAWEMLGELRRSQGRLGDALKAYERALALAPDREYSAYWAANCALRVRGPDAALPLARRAAALSPENPDFRTGLALVLSEKGDWPAAETECRAALRHNPAGLMARQLLALCRLRQGDAAAARADVALLGRIYPAERQRLERWLAEQAKR